MSIAPSTPWYVTAMRVLIPIIILVAVIIVVVLVFRLIKKHGLKKTIIPTVIIISFVFLAFVGTKIGINMYVKNNYDVRIVTDSGGSFFIFTTTFEKHYLVNSSLGIKIKTKKFDVKSEDLSDMQLQQLREIEKIDNKFIVDLYPQIYYEVFFYENFIFYVRHENPPYTSAKDSENIYKYNTDTKETQQIQVNKDELGYEPTIDVKLEALKYLYPNLKQAIASKCGIEKNHLEAIRGFDDRVYSFGGIYYDNSRIFFNTYFSSSARGTTEYLYEYVPANDTIRKIATTRASIVSIDIVK